nr:protein disulfide-isomerase-like [Ipomoea batatas]
MVAGEGDQGHDRHLLRREKATKTLSPSPVIGKGYQIGRHLQSQEKLVFRFQLAIVEGSSNSIAAPSPHSHYRRRPKLSTHAQPPSTTSASRQAAAALHWPPCCSCSPCCQTQLSHHLAAGRNCRTTSPPVALPCYSPGSQDGKLKPFLSSEPIPENNSEPVKVVVTDSLEEMDATAILSHSALCCNYRFYYSLFAAILLLGRTP